MSSMLVIFCCGMFSAFLACCLMAILNIKSGFNMVYALGVFLAVTVTILACFNFVWGC